MKDQIYRASARTSLSTIAWNLFGSGLRILAYHGICEDEVADEPWVPSYFVKRSRFEEQLEYLAVHTELLRLSDAVSLMESRRLPQRATVVTFDDGYANNLDVALPLLEKRCVPATIFVATAYTRSGELLPFDRLRLIHLHRESEAGDGEFYRLPMDALEERLRSDWEQVRGTLPAAVTKTLRPFTVAEMKRAPASLIEFGAHTRTHCILCHETDGRRREEIQDSLEDIRAWTGNPAPLFSYPTGAFDPVDKEALGGRCLAAVTTKAGRNSPSADVFELRRYPVAMNHTRDAFVAEITGLRALLARTRNR